MILGTMIVLWIATIFLMWFGLRWAVARLIESVPTEIDIPARELLGPVVDGLGEIRDRLPRWSGEDQDRVLAYLAEQKQRCRGCGTYEWERDDFLDTVEADGYRCIVCEQRDARMTEIRETDALKHGLYMGWYPLGSEAPGRAEADADGEVTGG